MGCDIHFYVEKKNPDGSWQSADQWETDSDGNPERVDPFYTGRNYDLFAILADVRNGFGFAGVKTGEGFTPIAAPRGLPGDASDIVRAESDRLGADGHSHSWFTVRELLNYDWTQRTKHQGWVTAAVWAKWKFQGRYGDNWPAPSEWCGGISGPSVRKLTNKEMENLLAPILEGKCFWNVESELQSGQLARVYTLAQWESAYWQSTKQFWSDAMPRLLALCAAAALSRRYVRRLDNVRAVFWFDN